MTGQLINLVDIELYAAADWVDVSERVQTSDSGAQAIRIGNGNRGSADAIPETASMQLTLDDTDGWLTPWNPMSPWYGTVDQNTPARCALRLAEDSFARTVASGWGSTDAGEGLTSYAWTNTGAGGSVLASDFAVTPGVGTHSVPTTVAYRQSTLDDVDQVNVEQLVGFRLPTANVTGGSVEPANLRFRVNAAGQVLLRVVVHADETVTLQYKWISAAGAETDLTAETVSEVVNSGQWIWVMGSVENIQYRAKVWADGDPEPLNFLVNESFDLEETFIVESGAIGVRTGVATGNSNAKPVIVSYQGWRFRSPRFTGFLASIAPQPEDPTLNLILTETQVSGPLRFIMTGKDPGSSTLRRSIPSQPGLVSYFPMEDGTGSTQFASALAGHPPMAVLDGTPSYASYDDLAASAPLPYANKAVMKAVIPAWTYSGFIQVRFFMGLPAAGSVDEQIIARFFTGRPGAWYWQLRYQPGGDVTLECNTSETTVVGTTGVLNTNLDGVPCRMSIELTQNGADVDWKVYALILDTMVTTTVFTGTMVGLSLQAVDSMSLNNTWLPVADRLDQCFFGHWTLQDQITSIFDVLDETSAYTGEKTFDRFKRTVAENGYTANVQPGIASHLTMGPQRVNPLPDLMREAIEVGNAFIYEARGDAAVTYREVTSMLAREFALTLTLNQLVLPWKPLTDTRDARNKWTVHRVQGSSAVAEQTTGPRSTLPPGEGGIGMAGSSITLNTEGDSELYDQATFRLSVSTVIEPRYPNMVVDRSRVEVYGDPVVNARLLDVRPGDRVEVEDTESLYLFDPVRQLMTGWEEELSRFVHRFTFSAVPAGPYDAFVIESATNGRLDALATTLDLAVTTAGTALTVVSDVEWWRPGAALPMPLRVEGEVVSCTAVSDPTPAFVAVGTAAHADNASVTPGMPAGTTTTGDVLLILAASRNTAAVPTRPSEYELLVDAGNVCLFGKYHDGSEVAPAVAVTGGSAGDTMSAVMASFRGMSLHQLAAAVVSSNASAQNIAFSSLYSNAYKAMALYIGWKQDDFTSVATVTNATEISEASSTTGNDQSLVWDYRVLGDPAGVIDGSFTVTGGASAISKGITVLFAVPQVMTVDRSVNGVVKTHPVGAAVNIFRQPHLAL